MSDPTDLRARREALTAQRSSGVARVFGSDRFRLAVSGDGSTFFDGLSVDNATGIVDQSRLPRFGNVVSADITYANNLDRIETIRSDGRIDGADPSIAALTGRIEVRFADQTLVSQAINGDPCEMEFAYVLPSGESLRLTVHAVYLPRPRIEISGPQGVQATFDWQAARDSVVGRMCTATLINDIEVY
ncbi:hypothetical protein GCM10011316_39460 [Roseibium aquae]|uniref:Uncharacterized protein n=1 Tax=Roseibium aquae TaxID=1323746 RepID=A0A916TN75_9HYPH|nr:phage tail tube protein [Roseibium aquae]GGB63735.1 hypothetical protein GCM10011316_39460 [Roseibium aquae]